MSSAMLLLCTAVRVIHALPLHTFFNPDEYWQSLEVAHQLTFGYVSYPKVILAVSNSPNKQQKSVIRICYILVEHLRASANISRPFMSATSAGMGT